MLKLYTKPLVIGLLTVLMGCKPGPFEGVTDRCDFEQSECFITENEQKFSLMISPQELPLEQELNVALNFPKNHQFKSAHIEGVNMYMGKIPVIVDQQQDGNMSGITFLGSCSEPNMLWRLVARFEVNGVEKLQSFHFSTSTN